MPRSSRPRSLSARKVLIVTDVIGGDAEREVGDLIEKTPRRSASYQRYTVTQEIVFDPEHPGEATVYAVVMDERELGQFRSRLRESFPTSVEEADPRPELLAGLSAGRAGLRLRGDFGVRDARQARASGDTDRQGRA